MDENNKNYEFALLERLESKVDMLIEGQRIMEAEHREMKEKIEKIDSLVEDMDYVKSALMDSRDRFKETDKEIKDHDNRIVKLENAALAQG